MNRYELLAIVAFVIAIPSTSLAGLPGCDVPIIQSEPMVNHAPDLPPNLLDLPRPSDVAFTTTFTAAPIRSDVPIIASASPEAVQSAMSIAMTRYPKAKPTMVRSDPIADNPALNSNALSLLKDVPVIESAPSSGASCN
jgi:hypothetical protein